MQHLVTMNKDILVEAVVTPRLYLYIMSFTCLFIYSYQSNTPKDYLSYP